MFLHKTVEIHRIVEGAQPGGELQHRRQAGNGEEETDGAVVRPQLRRHVAMRRAIFRVDASHVRHRATHQRAKCEVRLEQAHKLTFS